MNSFHFSGIRLIISYWCKWIIKEAHNFVLMQGTRMLEKRKNRRLGSDIPIRSLSPAVLGLTIFDRKWGVLGPARLSFQVLAERDSHRLGSVRDISHFSFRVSLSTCLKESKFANCKFFTAQKHNFNGVRSFERFSPTAEGRQLSRRSRKKKKILMTKNSTSTSRANNLDSKSNWREQILDDRVGPCFVD